MPIIGSAYQNDYKFKIIFIAFPCYDAVDLSDPSGVKPPTASADMINSAGKK
jgi:hypothetical protein